MQLEKWHTPFTHEQVAILNGYQTTANHEYTCGNDSTHRPLYATSYGWYCEDCSYIQNWAHATEDPYGIVGLRGQPLIDKMLASRWYAVEDDLIGGWCVMPVPLQPSYGYPEVGSFLSKDIAEHITDLHNMDLHDQRHDYV